MKRPGAQLERLFQALADRTRLRVLNLLGRGELCVCYFVAVLDEPQPKISRHLAYLRRAGLAEARREGKWIHYRLAQPASPATASILQTVLEAIRTDPEMEADARTLTSACCASALPPALADAPRPQLRS